MPLRTFGQILLKARTDAGLSQGDLSRAVGITPSFISDMEHDKRGPSDDTLLKIAVALEVDPDLFFAQLGRLPPDLARRLQQRPEWMRKVRGLLGLARV